MAAQAATAAASAALQPSMQTGLAAANLAARREGVAAPTNLSPGWMRPVVLIISEIRARSASGSPSHCFLSTGTFAMVILPTKKDCNQANDQFCCAPQSAPGAIAFGARL